MFAGASSSRSLSIPPRQRVFSTRCVSYPWSAIAEAAVIPAIPPPITSAFWIKGSSDISSGISLRAFSTAIQTMSFALRVASSFSCLCTQESILRMFDISSRYGFNPDRSRTPRKIDSWVLGEQAAMTTRLILCSLIACSISCWVLPAQENIWCEAKTTSGSCLA